jgi:(E)-4-hydroxy-3-methylbut-2-enyl-diphosphate synthase
VIVDEASAAEARKWLAENEDETAMTPERLAALEAEAAERENGANGTGPDDAVKLDEAVSPVAGRRFTRA